MPFKNCVYIDESKSLTDALKAVKLAVGYSTNALLIARELGVEVKTYEEIILTSELNLENEK